MQALWPEPHFLLFLVPATPDRRLRELWQGEKKARQEQIFFYLTTTLAPFRALSTDCSLPSSATMLVDLMVRTSTGAFACVFFLAVTRIVANVPWPFFPSNDPIAY